jgi:SAM-dependent methyltransferase
MTTTVLLDLHKTAQPAWQVIPNCRHCNAPLLTVFADLGATPVANDYLAPARRFEAEPFYPLKAYVCSVCRLVQLQDFRRSDELFREDYAYFSSVATSWLQHAKHYAATMAPRFGLDAASLVVEIASNDGYLLQYFKEQGIPVLGIDPCRSVAEYAVREKDIPTRVEFFGRELAARLVQEGCSADLMVANNVLAHVPDINDFVGGFATLLKTEGVATFEFPHLLNLIRENEFDTIYHEHFSYLSLLAAERLFLSNGMRIFDVERLSTHGGSLRLFACRTSAAWPRSPRVDEVLALEREAGLHTDEVYASFAEQVRETKRSLLELLIALKRQHKSIVGYGAPAKGNTLLNYCGIGADILEFTVDRSPAKQGMFLPGSRLEIRPPSAIDERKPDYILILPWNLKEEVMEQMAHVRAWGGRFIVPIPRARIIDDGLNVPAGRAHLVS